MQYEIIPAVNMSYEFKEIALDFANPLDVVREAISNGFDAHAKNMTLDFSVVIDDTGEQNLLMIEITDDGDGMDQQELQSFFDLGNSTRRATKSTTGAIGEKGHGTKVYFNSKCVEVITEKGGKQYRATMQNPRGCLVQNHMPKITVECGDIPDGRTGTVIKIYGYNNSQRDRFTHGQLKDYILWFTKFGSVERCFGINDNEDVKIKLKGIDRSEFEEIPFGHVFPNESPNINKLFDIHNVDAPNWYCKKRICIGRLERYPEIEFHAVFYIEGTKIKYQYNNMIKRQGYTAPQGAYTIQERYGIWLCKDYIPIQRKNEWITSKGNEHTRFHAFINCQALRLTANRGSTENTPSEILTALEIAVKNIYDNIKQSDDWDELEWLESESVAYKTIRQEQIEYKKRIDKVNKSKIAKYNVSEDKTITLIEPRQENGVFTIYMQLSAFNPNLFPFIVVDYDTHTGIDVIAKQNSKLPIDKERLFYVEFKNHLTKNFNHSFENLHSIVCWDINEGDLKHGEEVEDIAGMKRSLAIIPPKDSEDYTHYYLDDPHSPRKIEVFVLKYYLVEKLGINFVPRTADSVY